MADVRLETLKAASKRAGGAVTESEIRSALRESGADVDALLLRLAEEGLLRPAHMGDFRYWKPTARGLEAVRAEEERARAEAKAAEARKVEVLKWNARKAAWDRVRVTPEELEAWRSTPGRVLSTRPTDFRHDTSGLDYDQNVRTRVVSEPIGALMAEGVVKDKRVIDGRTEYLLKPHTKATRADYERQEKRRELAELERRVLAEPDAPGEWHDDMNRRIAALRAELGA